jgi:hypothetical protein
MIVVCSTSEILCKEILKVAGSRVQTEYDTLKQSGLQMYPASNGHLPCKKIFFLPWGSDRGDPTALKESLGTFVSTAIKYADKHAHQTIGLFFSLKTIVYFCFNIPSISKCWLW